MKPLEARVTKKVCFETDGIAGGTATYCGAIGPDGRDALFAGHAVGGAGVRVEEVARGNDVVPRLGGAMHRSGIAWIAAGATPGWIVATAASAQTLDQAVTQLLDFNCVGLELPPATTRLPVCRPSSAPT